VESVELVIEIHVAVCKDCKSIVFPMDKKRCRICGRYVYKRVFIEKEYGLEEV